LGNTPSSDIRYGLGSFFTSLRLRVVVSMRIRLID
jgi:hypothetical protein